MLKGGRSWLIGLTIVMISLMGTPAFARSISLKDAGVTLWIFIIIGAVIVLLQLIPAAILFFSFIGTSSSMVFNRKKVANNEATAEEKAVLTQAEPAPAKE